MDWREISIRITEFFIILLLAKSLLFMAFVASPLDAIMGVMANVEDFTNVTYGLLNFLIGMAAIGLSWSGRLVPGSSLSRVDGVVAS